jgi:MFS family permease
MRSHPVFARHPVAALAVICLSVFVISIDTTIVNVALPTLSRDLGADTAQLQWIVDAYTLVMSGLLLSAGSLSDRYGRLGWLNSGLALFAITSIVAAQADSADALIAARAAMGVGAAVIFPTTLGLITNIFTDPTPRAKAIGLWAAMVGVGVAVGPISGGWLLQHFSWGSIFLVNRDAVNHAFLDGLQVGSLVCAGIALAAAVVVAVLLPARARQATASTTTPALVEDQSQALSTKFRSD